MTTETSQTKPMCESWMQRHVMTVTVWAFAVAEAIGIALLLWHQWQRSAHSL